MNALRWSRGPSGFVCRQCVRRIATDSRVFAEGDIALLRDIKNYEQDGILTAPLQASKKVHTHRGVLPHSSIIGQRVRDIVKSSKDRYYRIHQPTLAEYIRFTPRLVTPIYPSDANLITSLLDLHVTPSVLTPTQAKNYPTLEILEAGTGHGALTLHLSRAIHAANPAHPSHHQMASQLALNATKNAQSPSQSKPTVIREEMDEEVDDLDEWDEGYQSMDGGLENDVTAHESWKKGRRAIIHTIDISGQHSSHAQKIVRGFKHGIYYYNVEFHVGDVSEWTRNEMLRRQHIMQQEGKVGQVEPFLSHAFLDLPGSWAHMEAVSKALRVDGMLLLFNPSITQIAEGVEAVRKAELPLVLESVLELRADAAARPWDVRVMVPRSVEKARQEMAEKEMIRADLDTADALEAGEKARDEEEAQEMVKRDEDYKWVCKPKFIDHVPIGGFLGIWRKTRKGNGGK